MKSVSIINSNEIVKYVKDFNHYAKKTAKAVLNMGVVVTQAKNNLSDESFNRFCHGIRFESKSSSIRKLIQIGQTAEHLFKHADNLPNSWTTIYELSKLSSDVLEELIDSGKVYSTISGKDAKQLVTRIEGSSETKSKKSAHVAEVPDDGYVLMLRFTKTPTPQQVISLEKALNEVVPDHEQFNVIRSRKLDSFMNASNDPVAFAA